MPNAMKPTGHLVDAPAAAGAVAARTRRLAEEATGFAREARAANTLRSYDTVWRSFSAFRVEHEFDEGGPIEEEHVGLWVAWLARTGVKPSSIRQRVSALSSIARSRKTPFDVSHPAIRDVIAGFTRVRGRPSRGRAAFSPDDVIAMLSHCERGTRRGLRDRALILLGYAGAFRRDELVSLDCVSTPDARGWIVVSERGLVAHVRGKTGWRQIGVRRSDKPATCPVKAVEEWMTYARVAHGPLFRRVRNGDVVDADRLQARTVYNLVKDLAARIGLDASEFGAHSLRAGHATFSQAPEADVQKQLGHAKAEMTRRYRRHRDPLDIDMTKALGL